MMCRDRINAAFSQIMRRAMIAVWTMTCCQMALASNLNYLKSLIENTPEGGWVRANTNSYSSVWAESGEKAPGSPAAVVYAWSSFAWDSNRGNLLLWGGGHANYSGNEIYIWKGINGMWERGSLSSRIDENNFVVDNSAPQSSHTYDNNLFVPINDRFLTFGGAAWNNGGIFQTNEDGVIKRAGPWLWDPSKADPIKVGGGDGSGYNISSLGGNMWLNRQGQWTGREPLSGYVEAATAYRTENGNDAVYVTVDQGASGFPSLYRYTMGDLSKGELDRWEKIGVMQKSVAYKGVATIDFDKNLFVRTVTHAAGRTFDLAVWDLNKSNAIQPDANIDIGIDLIQSDGTQFIITGAYGMDYDTRNQRYLLWDGSDGGTLWQTRASFNDDGSISPIWTISQLTSTTIAQPQGDFLTGVLGKWKYVDELGAFIALDEFRDGDAGVWIYKPIAEKEVPQEPGVIPEPSIYSLVALAMLGAMLSYKSNARLLSLSDRATCWHA